MMSNNAQTPTRRRVSTVAQSNGSTICMHANCPKAKIQGLVTADEDVKSDHMEDKIVRDNAHNIQWEESQQCPMLHSTASAGHRFIKRRQFKDSLTT